MKNEKGFATVFSLFMSLLLLSFCSTFVIVASVLSVKHKANHAAEEAALIAAITLDCNSANDIAQANDAEVLTCNIYADHVYIKTFAKYKNCSYIKHTVIDLCKERLIGIAKAR
jgi:secretion/DNA translocation related TadE-like protein